MPGRWIAILTLFLSALVAGCATLSVETGASSLCRTDELILINPADTKETQDKVLKHDRRLVCLCPDIYPELSEKMECPE